ncbi:hypothetical protein [Clostridium perfringens]|uniref:hypothetical protein n=1 Tax=Clostridium perfringens TaxID=1502 RepID=UPI002341BC15|nr:hypothetical protein [Clostridium perfringens]MDC4245502.1 hypothetical protein [Clostridium perfringens]
MTDSKEFFKKKNKGETVETLEKCKELLNTKIEKATKIAKENTKYNEQGYAVISKDDEWREDNEWNRDYDEYDSVFTRSIELDEEATKRFFEIVERQSKQSNESKYDDYDMLIKRLESKVALNKLFNATDKKEGKEIIPDKRDWSVIELMFRKIIEDGTSKEEIKQRVDKILKDIREEDKIYEEMKNNFGRFNEE